MMQQMMVLLMKVDKMMVLEILLQIRTQKMVLLVIIKILQKIILVILILLMNKLQMTKTQPAIIQPLKTLKIKLLATISNPSSTTLYQSLVPEDITLIPNTLSSRIKMTNGVRLLLQNFGQRNQLTWYSVEHQKSKETTLYLSFKPLKRHTK